MEAYRAARIAGMSDAEFWQSTPYLTRIHVECAVERERMAYHRTMFAVWHGAAWGRIKRMPPLSKALHGFTPKRGRPKRMTPDEMLAQIELWNVAFGGKDRRKSKLPPHAN